MKKIIHNYKFLLGVKDPEMDMIEDILIKEKMSYKYATHHGKQINLGNAYTTDPINLKNYETLVLIECEPICIKKNNTNKIIVIDHHREGDPGHNIPAKEYWKASSIGQLHKLLNIKPTKKALNIAAFDHCFRHAVNGECPDINPKDILNIKIKEISKTTGMTEKDINEKLEKYKKIIYNKKSIKYNFVSITDIDTGVGYSSVYLIFQLLSILEKINILFKHRDDINGRYKIILNSFDKEKIEQFIEKHKLDPRFEDVYGAPERGYAGAYYR